MAGVAKELCLASLLRFQSSGGMHRLRGATSALEGQWLGLWLELLGLLLGLALSPKGLQHDKYCYDGDPCDD
jgi:hypothetical protein